MPINNISLLKAITSILEINEVKLNQKLKNSIDTNKIKTAEHNSKLIFVYKIIYKSNGHKVVGYIAEPKVGKNLPCIIWNRGGSKEFGAIKEENIFSNSIAALAKSGYVVIATQYSGNAGSEGKDEHGGADLEDVLNLYKILKKYSKVNVSKIGMYGASRGGMETFQILEKVKWLKAVVVVAPLTNLVQQVKNRPLMKPLFKEMFGGSKLELVKRSVIFWVDKLYKKTPVLIMHGTSDWRVSVEDTLDLSKKFYMSKIPFRMVIFEGDDHGLTKNNDEAIAHSIRWFDRFVKNNEDIPNLEFKGK